MQSYMYISQRGRIGKGLKFIAGCLMARNGSEAIHNARFLCKERGASVSYLVVNKL